MNAEPPIKYAVKRVADDTVVLEFRLTRPIRPEELPTLVESAPDVSGAVLLVISGRGPIWLYGALLHRYLHSVAAIATFDPKVGGAVVVASHDLRWYVGQVVRLA